jgi:hypothetical protein
MTETEIQALIKRELPQLLAQDPLLREFLVRSLSDFYAGKPETESRFDRVLNELERDRQEQARKWDDQMAENRRMDKRFNSTMGAIGSRWGLYLEDSFRNGLKAILEESFAVEVLNINDFDETGEVFGRPEQIEIDVIITNDTVILCEIELSISKADLYSFDRKVAFYQKRHQRPVSRKMVISPMVDERAFAAAEALGIEVYSYADEVKSI